MIARLLVIVVACAWLALSFASASPKPKGEPPPPASTTRPVPSPDLAPQDVVKTVMDALRNNDEKDTGIRITFSFASPGNREFTGPIDRFIAMVKDPAYAPMLNHKSAEYG